MAPLNAFHLRCCLVSAPLAHELLARCFDLEARERAGLWVVRKLRQAPAEAVERWRQFQEYDSFATTLYPLGCPAFPDDAWPFTTFGEFLAAMADHDPRRGVWYELLQLRNQLAQVH